MLDEDVILKSTRYSSENLLILNIFAIACLPALFNGGSGAVALSIIFSLGIVAPINVFTFPSNWIDAPEYSRLKYCACIFPCAAAFCIALFRFFTPSLDFASIGGVEALRLSAENSGKIFSSAAPSFFDSMSDAIIILSSALCAFSIFIITKSRFVLKNMMLLCAAAAAALSLFGLAMDALLELGVPAVQRVYSERAFSTFADKAEFSYYAYIWASALFAAGIYTFQRFTISGMFASLRSMILAFGLFLFAIALYTSSPVFRPFIFGTLAVSFLIYAFDAVATKSNLKRHGRQMTSHSISAKIKLSAPFALYLALSISSAICAVFSAQKAADFCGAPTPENIEMLKIDSDAMAVAGEKKLFGWGGGSFQNIMALNQGDDIKNAPIKSPSSSAISAFLEHGYCGIALIAAAPFLLALYVLCKFGISKSGAIILAAALSLVAAAFVSTPFAAPSVVISCWILIGTFIAWQNAKII